jgi:hypothetical protein
MFMLSPENIQQILLEHRVREGEPAVMNQHPVEVVLEIAAQRARAKGRAEQGEPMTQLEDAIFVTWSFCWPIFPQSRNYNRFMRAVRGTLFEDVPVEVATSNARDFFTDQFLSLELHQLGSIVNNPDALFREPEVWNRQILMFHPNRLPESLLPPLRGTVYFIDTELPFEQRRFVSR